MSHRERFMIHFIHVLRKSRGCLLLLLLLLLLL
jgi:hypothetical protein